MKIGMIGHGMMGVWHSDALKAMPGVELATVVGRREEPTRAFAERYGYARWTTELDAMLAEEAIEAVVVASPSEAHVEHALRCFAAGKPCLVEIPMAMNLADAERVVAAGAASGLVWGLCHPMRFRREREDLLARLRGGEERIRHMAGRFFIHRLRNVGATGYERSWTDNILWHHFCHFVDLFTWLLGEDAVERVQSSMGPPHDATGIPMECTLLAESAGGASFLVHGSYAASFRLYDKLIVTDRDTYLFDILTGRMRTREGEAVMEDEQRNCARVTRDFLEAVREGRPPRADGPSVLPAMRVLQAVQDQWDARHGARDLPGRSLRSAAA